VYGFSQALLFGQADGEAFQVPADQAHYFIVSIEHIALSPGRSLTVLLNYIDEAGVGHVRSKMLVGIQTQLMQKLNRSMIG
jgi:hypothetical protein